MKHLSNGVKRISPCLIAILCFISLRDNINKGSANTLSAKKGAQTICYFEVSNTVVEVSSIKRHITLLLDSSNFNELTLRQLARQLFEKYPSPKEIHISLNSNIDQLREFILGKLEQDEPNEANMKYPLGIIFRANGNEIIRYTSPPKTQWRTIILKGKD